MTKHGVFLLLCVLLIAMGAIGIKTYGYPTATVYADPSEITGLNLGENFIVNVSIANVTNLAGWEFRLYFLSRVINIMSAKEGPLLKNIRSTIFIEATVTNSYNATHGLVHLACSLLPSGAPGAGPGILATCNFTVVGVGQTPLSLPSNQVKLGDTTEPPTGPFPIPHTTIDGYVRVGGNDVAVKSIGLYQTIVGDGNVSISATVENYGDYSATFNVTLYHNESEIGTQTVKELQPGNLQILTFTWDTTPVPKGNYTISAYAHPMIGEINIENNRLIDGWVVKTISGDLNGDGQVNILDISIVARAFLTEPGSPKWNPNADLDNNGLINILDISRVARQFGKEDP